MCFLITGTLPHGSDVQRVTRIAAPEGVARLPITNRHVEQFADIREDTLHQYTRDLGAEGSS